MSSLTVYEKITDPIGCMKALGSSIAESAMFGCRNVAAGEVLAWHCMSRQKDPLELCQQFHIISDRLSMKYDAMLAKFREMGGTHHVLSRTHETASIQLQIEGEEWTESLSWEEAKAEPWPYGKGNKIKPQWATARGRRSMLWARVVSEAVRVLRPEIATGIYTPEEIQDFDSDSPPIDVEAVVVADQPAESPGVTEPATDLEPAEPVSEEETNGACSSIQRARIARLFDSLGITHEQQTVILAKRNCQVARNLTPEQADELVKSLEAKAAERAAAVKGGDSKFPADEAKAWIHLDAPADQVILDEIRSMLRGQPDLIKQVTEHLTKGGRAKLDELTIGQAKILQSAMQVGEMQHFFDLDLAAVAVKN